MNLDPVGLPAVSPAPVAPAQNAEAIKPPSATENPPTIAEGRHADDSKREDFAALTEDEEDQFSVEVSVFSVHALNDADVASVIEAQTQSDERPDAQALAEDRRINEAFQAGVSVTSLLKIIRGADLSTISLLLGGSTESAAAADVERMPV